MLIDSHCHLDLLDQSVRALTDYLDAAKNYNLSHLLTVSTALDTFENLLKITEEYNNYNHLKINCSVGVHPNESPLQTIDKERLLKYGNNKAVIAIGETGLDYYYHQDIKNYHWQWQQERFRDHIEIAKFLKKPLIIHTRQAADDTINILKSTNAQEIGGVFHCFTENWEIAQLALDLGFYISFSGIVTFKNSENIKDVARRVPSDRFLIETDSPYLAPVPQRGHQNEPAFVKYVAEYLAELRHTDLYTIAEQSANNFYRLFFNL